jgi:hypothetical protein
MISGLRHRAAEQQQSRTATKLPACIKKKIKKIKKNEEENTGGAGAEKWEEDLGMLDLCVRACRFS